MKIPVSRIGKKQKYDILNSSGIRLHDEFGRLCAIIKDEDAVDNRCDKSPFYITELLGLDCSSWKLYNLIDPSRVNLLKIVPYKTNQYLYQQK